MPPIGITPDSPALDVPIEDGGGPGQPPKPAPPPGNEFKAWVDKSSTLKAETAKTIRHYIYAALIGSIMDGPSGLRVTRINTWKHKVGRILVHDRCVKIQGAAGGGGEVELPFVIPFDQTPSNGVLLQATASAGRNGGWPEADRELYFKFRALIEEEADRLIRQAQEASDKSVAISWAEIGAVASQPGIRKAEGAAECLDSILCPPGDPGQRGTKWNSLAVEISRVKGQVREQLLDRLSTSKGESAPSVIDSAVLVKKLARFPRIINPASMRSKDELVGKHCDMLADKMQAAYEEEVRRLKASLGPWCEGLEGLRDWDSVLVPTRALIDAATQAGLLSHATAQSELNDLITATPLDSLSTWTALSEGLERDSLTVWDFADDPVARVVSPLRSFITALNEELKAMTRLMSTDDNNLARAGAGDLEQAYRSLAMSLLLVPPGTAT